MLDELLVTASMDWLTPGWFAQAAHLQVTAPSDELKYSVGLGLLVACLSEEVLRPGDLTPDGFRAWDISASEAIVRVVAAWTAEVNCGRPTEFAWFELTEKGRRAAAAVLAS